MAAVSDVHHKCNAAGAMKVKFWTVFSHRLRGKHILLSLFLKCLFFLPKDINDASRREIATARNSNVSLPEKLWLKVGSSSPLSVLFFFGIF